MLPAGMQLAEPKARGMALLFDLSIVLVIFFAVSVLLPPADPERLRTTSSDQITKVNDAQDAQTTSTTRVVDRRARRRSEGRTPSETPSAERPEDARSRT